MSDACETQGRASELCTMPETLWSTWRVICTVEVVQETRSGLQIPSPSGARLLHIWRPARFLAHSIVTYASLNYCMGLAQLLHRARLIVTYDLHSSAVDEVQLASDLAIAADNVHRGVQLELQRAGYGMHKACMYQT